MKQTSLEIFLRTWRQFACVVMLAVWPTASAPAQTNATNSMPPPAPRRPSIILILADNIGYGDLGCYGQTKIKTPNLDKLAAEGIRFTSFYAASPEDAAARAALLTGMEPRHAHAGFNQTLPAEAVTLAALLKRQGYRTGLIGAWGLGDTGSATPDKNGFDEFAGFLSSEHARNYFTDRIWRIPAPADYDGQMIFSENEGGKRGVFIPDSLTTWAVNFVRINKPELLNQYRPFFLCLSYPIPHVSPNAAPPGKSDYADAPWPPLERIRATLISRMDDGVGQLLKKLADLKISTNTVVIFASVGGPEKGPGMGLDVFRSTGLFRGQHGSLNEGGLRVPLIVRWPAQIKGGGVSELACAGWDLFPTAAEIAFTTPPKSDGISLMPAWLGQPQTNRHEFLYWERHADGFQQAVRLGDWKAIRSATTNTPPELYNLKADPGEKENLATKQSEVMKKVEKIFNSARKESGQP